MASLSGEFNFQQFTDAGALMVGGRVYTYTAGTTTFKTAYTDSAGATPHTYTSDGIGGQYIALDSRGEIPAPLFLATGAYDIALKRMDGTTVWTRRAQGADDTALTALANSADPAKGAGMIGFGNIDYPAGTLGGYVVAQIDVLRFIPPAQWGAILAGTSTYDATAAIISAINEAIARAPARVVFHCGKYVCNSALGTFTGSNVVIEGNGSTLDFGAISLASTSSLLLFTGTYGAGVALTALGSEGAKSIAAPSSGFAAGDFVRIYSDTVFDPTRTSTKYGELNFIETVPSGAALSLTTELQGSYTTADSAMVEKLTPIRNVTVQNLRILGPGGNDELRGLRFRLGLNCHFRNISSFDVDYFHIQLTDCVDSTVTGCHFQESNSSSTAYGVSFADASQDCMAYGNTFVDVRHALSTNNNVSTSWGVTRRIRFELNNVRDSAQSTGLSGGDAIDTHGGAEDIFIINNTVHSSSGVGINVEARSAMVHGNRIKNTASVGIYCHPYSVLVGNFSIVGNRCEDIGDGTGTDPGIFVGASASVAPSRVTVTGNHVESSSSEAIRIHGLVASPIRYLTVSGNTLNSETGTTIANIQYAERGSITGNTGLGGSAVSGFSLADCGYLTLSGNNVTIGGTATNGYGYRCTGSNSRILMTGNQAINSGTFTNSFGAHLADTITNTTIHVNQFPGFTTPVTLGAGAGNVESLNT